MNGDSVPRNASTVHSSSPISPTCNFFTEGSAEDESCTDYGSFVCSDDEVDIEFMSEPVERYYDGIYYPIYIGEILADRYRIVHKLGWGGFSTVWMASDNKNQELVALKIGIAGDSGKRELKMYEEILETVKDASRFLALLDTFTLTGIKGTHLVMVFPVRGPSLHYLTRQVAIEERMRAAKHLLLAVKALHDTGYIHFDLHGGSMLWDMGDIHKYTIAQAYREFGRPKKAPLWGDIWKKGELVQPIEVDTKRLRGNIFLADFGLAIKNGSPADSNYHPPAKYCAPERFHQASPSFACDMWGYMCLFAELYLGFVPFSGRGNSTVLSSLVKSIGPLPLQWAGKCDSCDSSNEWWYDQTRKLNPLASLEETAKRARPELSNAERDLALSVFLKVWTYLPENRPTAAQLLEDKDFNALLAYYGC